MSVIYSSIKAAVKKRTPPATLHGALVWKEFNVVVALKSIIRQNQSQGQLKIVLMSMRGHKTTPEQAQWLQQFHWDTFRKTYGKKLFEGMLAHELFVFPTHAAEWNHNKENLLGANNQRTNGPINAHLRSGISDLS